ncbi:hypothetical protein EC957_006192, partial [Mortierella hygrophila]
MNNHPLNQLDANVPDKESASTAPPLNKRDKLLDLLGIPRSLPKVKAKHSTQSLKSLSLSQQTAKSSIACQVDSLQDKPLPLTPDEDWLRLVIFRENIAKHTVKTALPRLQDRIERTDQLLYCNMLLRQCSVISSSSDAGEKKATDHPASTLQAPVLDKGEQKWLTEIKEDPMRQDHMEWLVTKMVEAFIADATKDLTKVAEIVAIGPVLQRESYRKLLSALIRDFDDSHILDVNLLQGLVQLIQSASLGFLVSDDLVKVFSLLRTHLEGTHQHSSEHLCHLTLAVSKILD